MIYLLMKMNKIINKQITMQIVLNYLKVVFLTIG